MPTRETDGFGLGGIARAPFIPRVAGTCVQNQAIATMKQRINRKYIGVEGIGDYIHRHTIHTAMYSVRDRYMIRRGLHGRNRDGGGGVTCGP